MSRTGLSEPLKQREIRRFAAPHFAQWQIFFHLNQGRSGLAPDSLWTRSGPFLEPLWQIFDPKENPNILAPLEAAGELSVFRISPGHFLTTL